MIDYINDNICSVDEYHILRQRENDFVYLINNKLVVKICDDAEEVFKWYLSNQQIAPNSVFQNDNYLCHDYLEPSAKNITKHHFITFLQNYEPKEVEFDSSYFDCLEAAYYTNCQKLGIESDNLIRPQNLSLHIIHSDMQDEDAILFDNNILIFDPSPSIGNKIEDILTLYYSASRYAILLSEEELCKYANISKEEFLYFKKIILAR